MHNRDLYPRTPQHATTFTLTAEGKEVYMALPSYVVKIRLFALYGFIPKGKTNIAIKVKRLEDMEHETRMQAIKIQAFCSSFTAHCNKFKEEAW